MIASRVEVAAYCARQILYVRGMKTISYFYRLYVDLLTANDKQQYPL